MSETSDLRNVSLRSFARMAMEGLRRADLEMEKNGEEPGPFSSPAIRKRLQDATLDIAELAQKSADGFKGDDKFAGSSTWNRRHDKIGIIEQQPDGVSDKDSSQTIADIARNALHLAKGKSIAVQVGILQGTLTAILVLQQMSAPVLGLAAEKILDSQVFRMRVDNRALQHQQKVEMFVQQMANGQGVPAAGFGAAQPPPAAPQTALGAAMPASNGAGVPPPISPPPPMTPPPVTAGLMMAMPAALQPSTKKKLTERMVKTGSDAVMRGGFEALKRAAQTVGDPTAIALLSGATNPPSALAALAAIAPPPLDPNPNSVGARIGVQ